MNVAFRLKHKKGMHGVFITAVRGKEIEPVAVYLTSSKTKAEIVLGALTSGLLGRIVTVVMQSGG